MLQLEHPISQLNLDSNSIKQREKAWQSFLETGFGSKKTERWRYTDLASLYKKFNISKVKLSVNSKIEDLLSMINLSSDAHNVVFADGQLAYADEAHGLNIQPVFSLQTKHTYHDALDYLNDASCLSGAIIEIEKNVKLQKPVVITYFQTENSHKMMVNYQNSMVLQTNAECMVFEHFVALSDEFSAINICTNIKLNDTAKCIYDALANASLQKLLITHKLNVSIGKNAQYETFQLGAYSALNRVEFEVDLTKEGAMFNAKAIYVLAQSAKVDYRFNVKHLASNTHSDVDVRGVVGGKSSATFNAKAYVAKGLHGVKALQSNRNIQLSNTAEINTKPELEIYSDDVICSHGATIGQLDQQALFYLESRGIPKAQAISLLIEGFAKELIALLNRDETTRTIYLDVLEGHVKDFLL